MLSSAAITAHQISLMQVLGWMHWHHFAYMIVAVALLGFGIAGTVLSLAAKRLLPRWTNRLPWLFLLGAVAMPVGVSLAQSGTFVVDLPLVFHDPRSAWRLVALCLLLLPPFFCTGLATGLVLTVHARAAGQAYAASLLGAGLGGLAGLFVVATVEPPFQPAVVACVGLGAAAALWFGLNRATYASLLLAVGIVAIFILRPANLASSQFKPLRRTLDLPGARIIASQPSLHGWIQIVAAPALRPAPAVGFQFQGEIPVQPAVFINGLGHGSLLSVQDVAAPRWLEHTTDAAAFAVGTRRRVLLLENGPGGWAAFAAQQGAERIVVVEPSRALLRLLTASDQPFAPEWRLPSVTTRAAAGRAFLGRTAEQFDLIRFPTVGALGGTAGLNAAGEQFLLTREAFRAAWQRLAPGGVITVTAWMDFPERNPLRLLATLAETLEAEGALPRAHLAAVRGWATVTFLIRREPWDHAQAARLRDFSADRGFDPLLMPGVRTEERDAHHVWQNPDFFRLVDALVDGPRATVYRDYEFALSPSRDHRPYFSQFLRWSELRRLGGTFGNRAVPFFELGSLVVALTFLVLVVLATACIVLPLFRRGWHAPGKLAVLLYFGGLGAGYMAVEIGLMLWGQAWLGSPTLAAAVIVTGLLLASGLGSLWSESLTITHRTRRGSVVVVAVTILAALMLLNAFDGVVRAWPAAAGIVLLLAIVTLVGLPMGTAFPLGLRHLSAAGGAHIPWAWAINGAVSVATPAGVMLLAMIAGFDALLLVAAAGYGLALVGTLYTNRKV